MRNGGTVRRRWIVAAACCTILLACTAVVPAADKPAREKGWFNSTELGLVATDGNSSTRTLGLKHTTRRVWERSRLRLKLDAVQSDTADDPFAVSDPASPGGFRVVRPGRRPDVERYFAELRFDREISKHVFWDAGTSWDRNSDAGIDSRNILFAGVGNRWMDGERVKFDTNYGFSWTERDEIEPDPETDDRFGGVRVSWNFERKIGDSTTYGNDWTGNFNLEDLGDFNSDLVQTLGVAINARVALKVSLQWLHASQPALEQVPLFADETQGTRIGDVDIRRRKNDWVFRTSLVVQF